MLLFNTNLTTKGEARKATGIIVETIAGGLPGSCKFVIIYVSFILDGKVLGNFSTSIKEPLKCESSQFQLRDLKHWWQGCVWPW